MYLKISAEGAMKLLLDVGQPTFRFAFAIKKYISSLSSYVFFFLLLFLFVEFTYILWKTKVENRESTIVTDEALSLLSVLFSPGISKETSNRKSGFEAY